MWKSLAAAAIMLLALVTPALPGDAPRVVASIKPVHALAAAVMAGMSTPKLLVRGGQSPHTYALKPSDARALAQARLLFWVGPSIESFLIRPVAALDPSVHVVTLIEEPRLRRYRVRSPDQSQSVPLDGKPMAAGAIDGHIWLDPQNAIVIVTRMREELATTDPAHADDYAKNAAVAVARLQALDRALEARLSPLREKPFVVFHDAYQYFEQRYGLKSVGALAINPELQPGLRRLSTLRQRLVEESAVCAFAEPQFEPKLMSALTEGTAVRHGTLDPEGAALAPGADFYFTLLGDLASALEGCLQAGTSIVP
jgi:zinc transport system substrate-binding protein